MFYDILQQVQQAAIDPFNPRCAGFKYVEGGVNTIPVVAQGKRSTQKLNILYMVFYTSAADGICAAVMYMSKRPDTVLYHRTLKFMRFQNTLCFPGGTDWRRCAQ